MDSIKNRLFVSGLLIWTVATSCYFLFVYMGFGVSHIAQDGLMSLLTIYLPVLILTVFLLLYLTRYRARELGGSLWNR